MYKKLFLMHVMFFMGIVAAMAQADITGVVVSADDGEPVVGATVVLKGSKGGTVTDMSGRFALSAEGENRTITVSYVGMASQTLAGRENMRIVLVTDAEQVGEVVVTGLQKMDKRLFTGATSKVTGDDAKLDGVADISRALEGKAAGVSVQNVSGTFGASPKIRVRGATSIYGSSKPLWVVDGVIMEDVTEVSADDLSSGNAETLISSAIAGLNADDIESFQILKDGSATSIYGARAMAGVIVVTTKKGRAGESRINYTGEFTMRLKPSYSDYDIMNSQEQMSVYKEMYNDGFFTFENTYHASNSGVFGRMYHLMNTYDTATKSFGLANTEEAMAGYLKKYEYINTDWFDVLFDTNVMMNHSVSLTSGTEKAQYYTSFSLMDDPGWSKQSKVRRYTANINANYNISKRLTLNLIGNASYRSQRAAGTVTSTTDNVHGLVYRDFEINPYNYALSASRTLAADETYVSNYAPFSILNELENNYMELDVVDTKFQAEVKYKPITKVEIAALAAYKFSTTTTAAQITEYSNRAWAYRAMDDATIRDANPWLYTDPDNASSLPQSVLSQGGFYNEYKYRMKSWDFRATVNYNDVFADDHIVNLFGGMELNSTDRRQTYFSGVGMQYDMGYIGAYDYLFFKKLSEDNDTYYTLTNLYQRETSFFATATYSWKHRYTVNGTVRYEGSNRLGKNRSARWLPTWNISGAWSAHEEEWFESLRPTLSHLTLKASYSLTADRGPSSVSNSSVVINSYNPWRPSAADKETGLQINRLANDELTYEKKHELNIGIDMGFLDDRINVAFDWYRRDNYDLIGTKTTMGVGGETTRYANVASMRSHGEELTINTRNIETRDFKWSTSFIFAHSKNTVTELDDYTRIMSLISGVGFTKVGYPVRSLFSIDFQGLNSEGLPTFINQNGELTVSDINFQSTDTEYLKYEGPTDPTINGSFGNTFTWKGFRLNFFITYAAGNKVRLHSEYSSSYSDLTSMTREFVNRWTKPGDEAYTDVPVIADLRQIQNNSNLEKAYNAYNLSSARVAKGDFIRMKEISLSYDFPSAWAKAMRINALNLKLQATNLFLIYSDSKLNGQDPEYYNTGGVAQPMPRQFTLTVRLGI